MASPFVLTEKNYRTWPLLTSDFAYTCEGEQAVKNVIARFRSQMKTITRSNIYLPMAALILAALAIPAAARQQVPLKGTVQADEVHTHTSATAAVITGSGTGIASHLGKFSLTYSLNANLAALNETGSGTLIAANGDRIDLTITGSAVPSAPGVLTVTEVWTITGGTGRFAGARGSFIMDRQDYYLEVPIFTSGAFVGSIQFGGASD